ETIEEKSIDNFSKYTYNSLTILEDKKILELRKTIFNFKKDLEKIEEIERNLKEDLSTIRNNLFELELIELKLLCDDFNWLQKKKNNQILSDDDLKKLYF
ncbi:MAG: hypothetical protein H9Q67_05000, partial [Spiroplasma ixodetis]|nr:hypothetical protein [Spiroplasma ixodetis]